MTRVRKIAYPPGSHICALYNGPKEQLAMAVEYIRSGLDKGEQCFYICGEIPIAEFRKALTEAGINVKREEERGALVLRDKKTAYLPEGIFNPDAMIALLGKAVQEALDAGFSGWCGAGDLSWLLDEAPGSDRLAEYEAQLNDFYRTHKAHGLCLYNRRSLPSHALDHAIATHRQLQFEGAFLLENPYYEQADRAMRRKAADAEIVAEKLDILDATCVVMQA